VIARRRRVISVDHAAPAGARGAPEKVPEKVPAVSTAGSIASPQGKAILPAFLPQLLEMECQRSEKAPFVSGRAREGYANRMFWTTIPRSGALDKGPSAVRSGASYSFATAT